MNNILSYLYYLLVFSTLVRMIYSFIPVAKAYAYRCGVKCALKISWVVCMCSPEIHYDFCLHISVKHHLFVNSIFNFGVPGWMLYIPFIGAKRDLPMINNAPYSYIRDLPSSSTMHWARVSYSPGATIFCDQSVILLRRLNTDGVSDSDHFLFATKHVIFSVSPYSTSTLDISGLLACPSRWDTARTELLSSAGAMEFGTSFYRPYRNSYSHGMVSKRFVNPYAADRSTREAYYLIPSYPDALPNEVYIEYKESMFTKVPYALLGLDRSLPRNMVNAVTYHKKLAIFTTPRCGLVKNTFKERHYDCTFTVDIVTTIYNTVSTNPCLRGMHSFVVSRNTNLTAVDSIAFGLRRFSFLRNQCPYNYFQPLIDILVQIVRYQGKDSCFSLVYLIEILFTSVFHDQSTYDRINSTTYLAFLSVSLFNISRREVISEVAFTPYFSRNVVPIPGKTLRDVFRVPRFLDLVFMTTIERTFRGRTNKRVPSLYNDLMDKLEEESDRNRRRDIRRLPDAQVPFEHLEVYRG